MARLRTHKTFIERRNSMKNFLIFAAMAALLSMYSPSLRAAQCGYKLAEEYENLVVRAEQDGTDNWAHIRIPLELIPLKEGSTYKWEDFGDQYTMTYKKGVLTHTSEDQYQKFKTVLKADPELTKFSGFKQKVKVLLFFRKTIDCD